MQFTDRIYKEIDWFSAREIAERDMLDGIDSCLLLDNLATLEAGYSLDGELTDEMEDRVSDAYSSLITVGRFKFDSLLATGLAGWFHVRHISDIAGHVRSCWLSCDGDDGISTSLPAVAMTLSAVIFLAVRATAWPESSSVTS